MKNDTPASLSRVEKIISIFCPLQAKDGHKTCVFGLSGFFLMFSYYLIRPVREALVLSQSSAEVRAYAVGGIALIVVFLVPAYARWLKSRTVRDAFQTVLSASIIILILFGLAGLLGVPIGIPFFVWLGIFSLLVVAQFWAVATSICGVESGKRIFPAIALGLSLGALLGSRIVGPLFPLLGPYGLMIAAAAVLVVHLAIQEWILNRICSGQSALAFTPKKRARTGRSYGFSLVLKNPYLLKIAILVTLLNWIDSTGDYLLANAVQVHVLSQAGTATLTELGAQIGAIYSDFFFWVCVLGLFIQLVAVSRVFRTGGVQVALLVMPICLVLGYAMYGIIPVFTSIYLLKILEASLDYSIQGTAKHALFLPLNPIVTCHAKMTIETFFWRFGDLVQALMIFLGLNFLNLGSHHFAAINLILAVVCISIAASIGRDFRAVSGEASEPDKQLANRRAPDVG